MPQGRGNGEVPPGCVQDSTREGARQLPTRGAGGPRQRENGWERRLGALAAPRGGATAGGWRRAADGPQPHLADRGDRDGGRRGHRRGRGHWNGDRGGDWDGGGGRDELRDGHLEGRRRGHRHLRML
jgi:hypothetical protein